MKNISNPPRNSIIVFREPFPRREWIINRVKYYIRVSINEMPEQEIRINSKQQIDIIDYLIKTDLKLTGAIVRCNSQGEFRIISHSPQQDFFSSVKEV